MAKKVENYSILILFIARVFIVTQLFQNYAKSEILDTSISSFMIFLDWAYIYTYIYIYA